MDATWAVLLILAGLLVLGLAWFLHKVLLIAGVVIIAFGAYLAFGGTMAGL